MEHVVPTFLITVFSGRGPKTVKLFTNHPNSMDFDSAENFQAVQTLEYVTHVLDLTIYILCDFLGENLSRILNISRGSPYLHDNLIKDNRQRFFLHLILFPVQWLTSICKKKKKNWLKINIWLLSLHLSVSYMYVTLHVKEKKYRRKRTTRTKDKNI